MYRILEPIGGEKIMSERFKMSDTVRLTGVPKSRINEMIKRQLINPEKIKSGYVFNEELIDLIIMYNDLKSNIKMPYSTIKSLDTVIDNTSSFAERIQEIYEVFQNYDCSANYVPTKKFFYVYCNSILGLSDEFQELLEEITGDINEFAEPETLQSMYNNYLFKAYVIDTFMDLSNLELETETEFWNLDVVKGYETYIFNIVFKRPLITAKIDEFIMCNLMKVKYDSESKSDPLIKKLTLLLKKVNKFHDDTKIEYDTCQLIFLHAIMLLSLDIFDTQQLSNL
jgi:hypothetical protein